MIIKRYRQQKQRALLIIKKWEHLTDNIISELSTALNDCVTKLSIVNAVAQFQDFLQFIDDVNHRLIDVNNKKAMVSHHDIDNCTQLVQLAVSVGAILLQRLNEDKITSTLSHKLVLQLTATHTHLTDLYLTCMQLLADAQTFDAIETCCNLLATSNNTFNSKILTLLPKSSGPLSNQIIDTINKSQLTAFQVMVHICITTNNYQKALNYLVFFKRTLNGLQQNDTDYLLFEKIYLGLKNEVSAIVSLLATTQPTPFVPYCDTNDKALAVKKKISEACVNLNCQGYLFGGAMRDHCPSDLDIVLVNNSHAQNFITTIKQTYFILSEYEKYGRHVIQANIDGYKIDFTFFDGDIKTHSANLDFTVNALYQDLRNGNIIEPQEKGITDLQQKVIRCITDPLLSLKTNPVRILRAVKIIAKCGYIAHESITTTLTAMFSENNYFCSINADRLYAEFINLFMQGFGYKSYTTLVNLNLLQFLFPTLDKLTDEDRHHAKRLIEFILKFIDRAVNEQHEIIPPTLLFYAIHWHDLNAALSNTPIAPWINLQYGDYPAFNPMVDRYCKTFILRFLANEIDETCRWYDHCELLQQQDSNIQRQHNNFYTNHPIFFIWQPTRQQSFKPASAQISSALSIAPTDPHASLKFQ